MNEVDDYISKQVNLAVATAMKEAEGRFWEDTNKVLFEIRDYYKITRSVAVATVTYCVLMLLIFSFLR